MPAQAGIQYAAADRHGHDRHGVLDRPVDRAMTVEFVAAARQP
jgi:hypothetical protein